MNLALQTGLIMFTSLPILLLIGVPISISIGFASTLSMLMVLPFEGAMVTSAQRLFIGTNSFSLVAIPFFILAGNIMNNGGIALRLINCAKLIGGKLPGSLAQSNIVANMLFGAISGSGVAAAAAVGGTIGPIEKAEGYKLDYSAAVNIASAPTGMLIPPSNTLIVYSTVAGSVSISALFI
ncbi:MAG: TRAP transporter large permease subunit, partial [Fusobacteriaceae bacterium]